jgi:hypothetical protein
LSLEEVEEVEEVEVVEEEEEEYRKTSLRTRRLRKKKHVHVALLQCGRPIVEMADGGHSNTYRT